MTGEIDILTLTAALIGATSLIFAAKGNVWAQILMIFLLCTGICVKRYCIDYFVGYGIYQRSVIFSSGSKFHDLFPKCYVRIYQLEEERSKD